MNRKEHTNFGPRSQLTTVDKIANLRFNISVFISKAELTHNKITMPEPKGYRFNRAYEPQPWSGAEGEGSREVLDLSESDAFNTLHLQRLRQFEAHEPWPEGREFDLTEVRDLIGPPLLLETSYRTPEELFEETKKAPPVPEGMPGSAALIPQAPRKGVNELFGEVYHLVAIRQFRKGGMSELVTIARRDRETLPAQDTEHIGHQDRALDVVMTDEEGHVEQVAHDRVVVKIMRFGRTETHMELYRRALREVAALHTRYKLVDVKEVRESNGTIDIIVAVNEIPGVDLSYKKNEHGELRGENPFSDNEMLSLMKCTRAVVKEMQHMKKRGVMHRDIKPGNIILNEDDPDSSGLVDWGIMGVEHDGTVISKALLRTAADTGRLDDRMLTHKTEAGVILGTPGLFSPYVVAGRPDPNRDRCALGRTMIEVLHVAESTTDPQRLVETQAAILEARRYSMPQLSEINYNRRLSQWSDDDINREFVWLMYQMGQIHATVERYNPHPIPEDEEGILTILDDLIRRKEEQIGKLGEQAQVPPVTKATRRTVPAAVAPLRPSGPMPQDEVTARIDPGQSKDPGSVEDSGEWFIG